VKSPTKRRVVIVALLLAPTLAACGFSAQTDQVYQPAVGIIDRDGPVDILNALIVSGQDGSGTFAGSLVNTNTTEDDRLDSVTGPGIVASRRTVVIKAGGAVNLADTGQVTVTGNDIVVGKFVELTLVLDNGQSSTITVPVVAAAGDYVDVPLPRSSPSADETAATE
jgi:hypothetical protein